MTANPNAPKKQIGRPFQKGTVPNPLGRPKGSRNKLGEVFIQALYADFVEHGPAVIEQVRVEKPDVYLKVTASILPQQVQIENKSDMTDDELNERIRQLANFVEFATGHQAGIAGTASGEEAPARPN
jgi:hypothetical protein